MALPRLFRLGNQAVQYLLMSFTTYNDRPGDFTTLEKHYKFMVATRPVQTTALLFVRLAWATIEPHSAGHSHYQHFPQHSGTWRYRHHDGKIDMYPHLATNVCFAAETCSSLGPSHLPVLASTTCTIDEPWSLERLSCKMASDIFASRQLFPCCCLFVVCLSNCDCHANVSMHLTIIVRSSTRDSFQQ